MKTNQEPIPFPPRNPELTKIYDGLSSECVIREASNGRGLPDTRGMGILENHWNSHLEAHLHDASAELH